MAHTLPALPYHSAALEPHIDARTMSLHHDRHHAGYVEKLNAAIERNPELSGRSAWWLLCHLDQVAVEAREAVGNNAGGHLNHSLLWSGMTPNGRPLAEGPLADAIDRDFGSFGAFKARFEESASAVLGSGWIWLVCARADGGRLRVSTTPGNANPLTQGDLPLLVNDLWEHAYYLKHENRRADYVSAWWPVVDWDEVARRFERTGYVSAERAAPQGELLLETS